MYVPSVAAFALRPNETGTLAAVTVVALGALALASPAGYAAALLAACALAATLLGYRHPVVCSALWLCVVGLTPEMWTGHAEGALFGSGQVWALTIAAEKAAGFGLVALLILRFGLAYDVFNPALGFAAIGIAGYAHGLEPRLESAESVRSVVGSASLYAFSFARLPRSWAGAIILVCRVLPIGLVVTGAAMDVAGFRPLFTAEEGSLRLAATGHPAYLGGMAQTAIYACLLELFRTGRLLNLPLLAVNAAILVLTGARAPLAIGTIVCLAALLLTPAPAFAAQKRIALVLAGGLAVSGLAALALTGALGELRLFDRLASDPGGLSNRDLMWPLFLDSWARSPFWGWGMGAAKTVLDPDSALAHFVGTTAAHNEYLRMLVEGGVFGVALLIGLFAAWVWSHTRRLARPDATMMRLVFLGFAAHCYTDNMLIATSSSVFFAWVSAVFARTPDPEPPCA